MNAEQLVFHTVLLLSNNSVQLSLASLPLTKSAGNLDIMIENELTLAKHVPSVTQVWSGFI